MRGDAMAGLTLGAHGTYVVSAAASIGPAKQARLRLAAGHYLLRLPVLPPCRFDVVAIDKGCIEWIPGAFDAG